MINENDLLEPRKAYETILKDEIKENAEKYFAELAEKANVDVAANAETIRKLTALTIEQQENAKIRSKKQKTAKLINGLGITGIIVSVLMCFIFNGFQKDIPTWAYVVFAWVVPAILLSGAIVGLVMKSKKITPIIKNQNAIIARLDDAKKEQVTIGYSQMKALNDSFTWNMQIDVVNNTTPLIKLDKFFDFERLEYLTTSFNYVWASSANSSTVHVLSGQIIGNPFIIETQRVMNMGTFTYEGSLTITYRVRVPNGGKNGGYHYETRTQTLRAYLTKPKPYYNYEKRLSYGCDAAPDLSFSRVSSGYSAMNEKDQKKYIAAEEKKLDKMLEDKTKSNFTALGNKQFEALFHAWDRDNEVQFRLLFTPLAQKNYLDLIKNKEPYGDDFSITKTKKLNTVYTNHSQYTDYVGDPTEFNSYSYEEAKSKFVSFNETFFKSFYFDMATLLSIPLYQQYPTDDFIFNKKVENNITIQEVEAIANAYSEDTFKPLNCSTPLILKTKFIKTEGIADRIEVTAHGYKTVEHVDYVPMWGKDGILHQVPVRWIEYIPVKKESQIEVLHHALTRDQLNKKKETYEYKNFVSNNVWNNKIVYSKEFFSFLVPADRSYTSDSFSALLKQDD